MPNVYSGVRNGFMQEFYHDQQGTALPGSLAFAGDCCLIDSYITGEVGDDGLEAGLAVVAAPVSSAPVRAGLNQESVTLPDSTTSSGQLAGITVRNQQMNSNAAGRACWFAGELCNLARAGRAGARLWVQLAEGALPALGGNVYVCVDGACAGKFTDETALSNAAAETAATPLAALSAALDGDAPAPNTGTDQTDDTTDGTTDDPTTPAAPILFPNARFRSAAQNGLALVELL